jgi:GT2 family glycosyltransferase
VGALARAAGLTVSRVAVIIVSYNTREHVRRCLLSLRAHASDTPFSVHVADNGSADGVLDLLAAEFPWVKAHPLGSNRGFGAACNLVAARCGEPWLLLLNPDTEVLPGAIDAIVRFAERHPEGGLYGGRTLGPDGAVDPGSCWGLPTPWSATCFALGINALFPRNRWLDPDSLGPWQRDSVRRVGAVTGCLLLVSRGVWDELGGFDEHFFVYGEDFDLSRRAADLGYRPMITPECRIVHSVGGSSPRKGARRVLVLRGRVAYINKHWGRLAARYGQGCLVAGAWLRGPAANRFRRWMRRAPDESWQEAWERRSEWIGGFAVTAQAR